MADDILAFQAGREAAINGERRDGRRSPDWLEGYDQVAAEKDRPAIIPCRARCGWYLGWPHDPGCPGNRGRLGAS